MNVSSAPAILSLENVSRYFGAIVALRCVNLEVFPGQVHCLLGDNGAGKSTLIKILSGVYQPSDGAFFVDGINTTFTSPRDALDRGIATVYQDLALVPLMSISRNFVLGQETAFKAGPFGFFDLEKANRLAAQSMAELGIHIRDPNHLVANLSGGEKQCLAIARAVHFGARVLILDEPTAALGVTQTAQVLNVIQNARKRGIAIIFITHNIHHAFPIADHFIVLNKGHCTGSYKKADVSKDFIFEAMSGGQDMAVLEAELSRNDTP
ncbi:ATP-binding cassette domain-containing protein [Lacimicrobium alkaliphilum]|uniref:ABC transporter ATP-binding protein n=1 Tax=Lacimicrobium alkaliphilum TaxID=1526571 RepID=A0A0U2JIH1_9ALTE|nr:ATP-binding cassette domain-containing protein [Lacimicrobium alkaliphilum]ALS97574.1 ABC transporter ATP-binding protein [Lacimicrobium alkaliphilum]